MKQIFFTIILTGAIPLFQGCGDGGKSSGTIGPAEPGLGAPSLTGGCVAGNLASPETDQVAIERAFPNLSFDQPLLLLQYPGDASRFFLVEKPGRVLQFSADNSATQAELVVDLSAQVDARSEGGLLGMAFDPSVSDSVYLSYTTSDNGANFRSHLSRFRFDIANRRLDPNSETVLLRVAQPFDNHNGGHIAFGPDGYLYFGLGDGGSGNDPKNNGQDTTTLLGAMLRLDVHVTAAESAQGITYKIPADNPFAASPNCSAGGCPEIYAWGLRNPWRWSFDRETGTLWAADVGQNAWEEIDRIDKGKNYGWRCYEGRQRTSNSCPAVIDHTPPVYEYEHPIGGGRSVTGGFVYRGRRIPALTGTYLFADFVTGTVSALREQTAGPPQVTLLAESGDQISSFGEDNEGEIYLLGFSSGNVYCLVPGTNASQSRDDTRMPRVGSDVIDQAGVQLPRVADWSGA